jgi:hypothetical protein
MRGIRNKVIHDYFDVAWDVVWDTIQSDFPPLLQQISSLLKIRVKRTRRSAAASQCINGNGTGCESPAPESSFIVAVDSQRALSRG